MRRLPVALLLHHAMLSAALQIPPIQSLTVKLKSGHELQVYEVQNADDALDVAIEDDSDPFGSFCWPASVAAADALVEHAERRGGFLNGQRVLEIGAGPGLASVTAATLKADVTATDVSALSLRLLSAARDAAAETFDVQRLDILDAAAVRAAAARGYDVVVASDTLYQTNIAVATASALAALKPRLAIVCDPGRDGRVAFLEEARRLGFAEAADDFQPTRVETGSLRLGVDRPSGTEIGVFRKSR